MNYEKNNEYFSPSRLSITGIVLLAVGLTGFEILIIGFPFLVLFNTTIGITIFLLSNIVVAIGIVFFVRKKNAVSDIEYDEEVTNFISKAGDLSHVVKLFGISDDSSFIMEPIVIASYAYDGNGLLVKLGKDNLQRTTSVKKAVLCFGQENMYCYLLTASTIEENVSETTCVIPYKNILSVSIKDAVNSIGKVTVNYHNLVIEKSDGESYLITVTPSDTVKGYALKINEMLANLQQ